MSSAEKILADAYEDIDNTFRRYYNYHQLHLYRNKMKCF